MEDLLLHQGNLNHVAQQVLLNEVEPVFTEQDNQLFLTPPTKDDDRKTVNNSNLLAAPGTDGIPGLVYKECWNVLGDHLTAVMNNIFKCKELPMSMRTSLMVFGSKPKKPGSLLPKDKRRISLLNSDFKVATGLETRKFKATASHTLSHLQLVAGDDRRIHHGINQARNAIYAAGKPGHTGCGILDTDLIAAFDWLCLEWVYMVLEKKGLDRRVIASLPVQGPLLLRSQPLPDIEERYKVIGYADDVKPAVTSMAEFKLVDSAMALFEGASGCRLHRDPATKKCKFLPLARWRGTLQQSDIP